jgi:hypothetical protein
VDFSRRGRHVNDHFAMLVNSLQKFLEGQHTDHSLEMQYHYTFYVYINIICTISDDCNHCRPVEEDENIRAKYLTNIYWHSRILYFEKKNYQNMKIYCSQI